jgi:hypothetical protein
LQARIVALQTFAFPGQGISLNDLLAAFKGLQTGALSRFPLRSSLCFNVAL